MKTKQFFLSVSVLLFCSDSSSGQNKAAAFDSLFSSLYGQKKFNGNVLIAGKGTVIYKKSFGIANEQTQEKLNEHSVFELASVSKQFTAMAVVILREKGKLRYDDKISRYIPEFVNYSGGITIKNLLQHTSGLPDYMELLDSLLIDSTWNGKTKTATNKDIVKVFAANKPALLFSPGQKWEYSNTGYALLASIIERVSGKSYAEFLQENIFVPLQMNNSFVYTRRFTPRKVNNYAFGYVYSDSLKKNILPDDAEAGLSLMVYCLDGIVGDGAVNSTIEDLFKWDRALYTDKLAAQKNIREVFETGILSNNKKTDYGFGWMVQNIPPYGNLAYHSGSWPGYRTYIERNTDSDKTIIFLENNDNPGIFNPIHKIRQILYDIKPGVAVHLSTDELKVFAGNYITGRGTLKSFFIKNDKLYITINEQVQLQLEPLTKTTFKVVGFTPEVIVEFFIKDGISYKHIATQEGKEVEATRVK
jgi:CubicO group peptidase (beta-lactamase class C family)